MNTSNLKQSHYKIIHHAALQNRKHSRRTIERSLEVVPSRILELVAVIGVPRNALLREVYLLVHGHLATILVGL